MYGSYGVPADWKPEASPDAYDYNVWLYRSVLTIAMEMASVDLKLKDTTSTDTVKYIHRHQALETMRRPQETKNGKCQLSGMSLRIVTGMHMLLNGEVFWIFNKRTKSQYGGALFGDNYPCAENLIVAIQSTHLPRPSTSPDHASQDGQ